VGCFFFQFRRPAVLCENPTRLSKNRLPDVVGGITIGIACGFLSDPSNSKLVNGSSAFLFKNTTTKYKCGHSLVGVVWRSNRRKKLIGRLREYICTLELIHSPLCTITYRLHVHLGIRWIRSSHLICWCIAHHVRCALCSVRVRRKTDIVVWSSSVIRGMHCLHSM